jgi:ribonuclease HIII
MNNTKPLTSYVTKITENQAEELFTILKEKSFEITHPPYTFWKGKYEKLSIVAYESGKLVIQGKETRDFILYTLEPLILKKAELGYQDDLSASKPKSEVKTEPFTPHIGIDESGKGDFFGPLVIAAVFVDDQTVNQLEQLGVKDSKLIKNDIKILDIAQKIRNIIKGKFAVVAIGPEAYNRVYNNFKNLNKLLAWGHSRSLENLLEKDVKCDWALSDKFANESLIINTLFEKGKKIELRQQTKAESDIAVAAASILARADFVTKIKRLEQDYRVKLPKGAGANVLKAAVDIIRDKGINFMPTVSKMHFKTYNYALEKAKA